MSGLKDEDVKTKVESGATKWVYELNKETLLKICAQYGLEGSSTTSIDELRKTSVKCVKSRQPPKKDGGESSKTPVVENTENEGKPKIEKKNHKMAGYLSQIEPFQKGGNWSLFEEQLDAFIELNEVAEEKKTPLLLTRLSTAVFEDLRALCDQKPLSMKYKDLVRKLRDHYILVNEHLHRYAFRERKQKPGETIQNYVVSLRTMAHKCKFATTEMESHIKDQLISGVNSQLMQYELLKSSKSSLADLVELAKTIEIADAKVSGAGRSAMPHNQQSGENSLHAIFGGQRKDSSRNTKKFSKNKSTQKKHGTASTGKGCYCCGKDNHVRSECSLKDKFCSECGQKGHIYKMCKNYKSRVTSQNFVNVDNEDLDQSDQSEQSEQSEDSESLRFASDSLHSTVNIINNVSVETPEMVEPHTETLIVNDREFKMQVDTGAAISAISEACYKKYFANVSLKPSGILLQSYNKKEIPATGIIKVFVKKESNAKPQKLSLYVIKGGGGPILGRNWLQKLGMWPIKFENSERQKSNVDHMSSPEPNVEKEIVKLKNTFPGVFAPGFGAFTKGNLKLKLQPGTQPKFLQPRKIPIAIKGKVENEIGRLVENKIIVPVEYSEWGTPVVPILKDKGAIRLCGDFKVTLNKYLCVDHFPLPRIEWVFEILRGGAQFTKLDLREAYQQLPLDEESQKYVVISTHLGLFKYLRLPYGISTGPGSFQRKMQQLLLGIEGVVVFIDDILITAHEFNEHLARLHEVLRRLDDAGLRIKFEKCQFLQPEVKYLGFKIDKKGIYPLQDKLESVRKAPRPQDVSQLRSFIGSINYYGRFIENLAVKLHPLYNCLEKGKFEWTSKCEEAFNNIKRELTSEKVLIHFDPEKPIIVTTDASPYGISAVLSHRTDEEIDRPVCFASRTLTACEKNYSQLDKEGLAIIFGIKKFFEFLYGFEFTLQTDNLAIARILDANRQIPEIAAARLQRWAVFLSTFRYTIRYIRGKNNYADWLSRLPVDNAQIKENKEKEQIPEEVNYTYLNQIKDYDFATLDWKVVQRETKKEVLLNSAVRCCLDGWPEKPPKDDEMRPFWEKRDALSVDKNCLLWGHRIVIPTSIRPTVLHELHHSHFGTTRMKALARSFVWWPGLDREIEEITLKCLPCLEARKNPPKIPLTPWVWPTTPWHRIHADFLGPILDQTVLVILDSHSKWPEAFVMKNMSEIATITVFEEIFTRFGLPAHLVSDNFATFTGNAFKQFVQKRGIRHSTSAPHHPATNGAAENFVDTFKRKVKCIAKSGATINEAIRIFLFDYRTTPHAATQQTPAKLIFGRELRTRFSLLRPPITSEIIHSHQTRQAKNHRGARVVEFRVGDAVMTKDYRGGKETWTPGVIENEITPGVTYDVKVEGQSWKRHANQILARSSQLQKQLADKPMIIPADIVLRRSKRIRERNNQS